MAEQRQVTGSIVEAAAHSRIDELAARSHKDTTRAMWALGDYHTFARTFVWEVGAVLVEAAGIGPGQRVLDVAAGTGNVAIRAAAAGAAVVASDLTPENFGAGRREAETQGVELEWVEGDAEALPFGDEEFDVVTSCFGVMFAPDHARAANELLRVCKPGGTIGVASFTPEGLGGEFFALVSRHAPPPPPGALPPVLWGSEEHVHELLGDRVSSLEMRRLEYVERAPSPAAYVELFRTTFGPMVALREALGERAAELDRDFLELARRADRGGPDGAAAYHYEYLLVVARKRGG